MLSFLKICKYLSLLLLFFTPFFSFSDTRKKNKPITTMFFITPTNVLNLILVISLVLLAINTCPDKSFHIL